MNKPVIWVAAIAVMASDAISAPTKLDTPESVVTFYVDAVRRESISDMLSVRDLRRQAYSESYEKLNKEPNPAMVDLRVKEINEAIKKSIAPPKLQPRTCRDLSTHYESASLAQVSGVCDRSLGGGVMEQSVLRVLLALTEFGWRIVSSGADE